MLKMCNLYYGLLSILYGFWAVSTQVVFYYRSIGPSAIHNIILTEISNIHLFF